jgi:S1-C subfamily serine protease
MNEHDATDGTPSTEEPAAQRWSADQGAVWTPPAGTALPAKEPEPATIDDQNPVGMPPDSILSPPPHGAGPGFQGHGAPHGAPQDAPFGASAYGASTHFGPVPPGPATAGGGGGGWGYVPWTPPGAWSPGPHGASARRGRNTLALVVVAAVVAAVLGAVIGHAAWQPSPSSISSAFNGLPGNGLPPGQGGSSPAPGPSNAGAIAAKVSPGLVDINTTLSYQDAQAAGTGMVLTPSGEVLTNNHVIEEATSISVTDIGNGKTYGATVVGYDRTHDIAVLQLKGASGLETVTTGDSSKVRVGQQVVGIGNAGGRGGTPSYAGGTVTALNQTITASDASNNTTEQLTGLIEDDANIQPGDSGGPLVTTSGQVIGMDTAASQGFSFQASGAGAQGYAIPIDQALSVAKQIESGTTTSGDLHIGPTAFLGVEVQAASSSTSPFGGGFGSPFGGGFGSGFGSGGQGTTTSGALIVGVIPGSPAAQAGLTQGDTITAVAGHTISSPNDLTAVMVQQNATASVPLTYVSSSGQQQTVTVHLTAGPPQ